MRLKNTRFNDWLLVGATLALLVVCLPILAAFVFVTRFALVAAAVAVLAGGLAFYALSPRFRDWLHSFAEGQMAYKGLELATDVAVSPTHSWARIEPDSVQVGADDLVQKVLGPVEDAELPPIGQRVRRGERLASLRRGDRTVELRAPVTGTVVGRNRALGDHPELINEEPYSAGWIARLRADDPRAERRRLRRGHKARSWFRQEVDRLIGSVLNDEALAPSLPDGGPLVGGLHAHLDDEAWRRIEAAFFTAESEDETASR